jgi:hypothetical protein
MADMPNDFISIRKLARSEFYKKHKEYDSPSDYIFEDFEFDLIMDSIRKVEENDLSVPYPDGNQIISDFALQIECGLRAMRDNIETDSNNDLASIISSHLKKKAH